MVRLSPAPGKSATTDVLAAARCRILRPSACWLLRAQRRAAGLPPAAASSSAQCAAPAPAARSRDRLEPPCRRVDRPQGTALTCTGVSPRATRYVYKLDTNDGRLTIVRAQPGLPVRQPHDRAVAATHSAQRPSSGLSGQRKAMLRSLPAPQTRSLVPARSALIRCDGTPTLL